MELKRYLTLLCCLMAAAAFAVGCGDDDPDPDPDTTDTDTGEINEIVEVTETDEVNVPDEVEETETETETTDDGDGFECCTDAECVALGQICNETTCECEDDVQPGECSRVGETCDLTLTSQPFPYTCIDDGTGNGLCRQTCTTSTGTDPCPSGSVCLEEEAGQGGWCEPSECTHFFTNDCDAGEKCIPIGNNANFCFPNGMGADGDECESHADCGDGMICAGTCTTPDCSAITATEECPSGQACGGFVSGTEPLDLGICYVECEMFVAGNCPAGQWCFPIDRDPATQKLMGSCEESENGTVPTAGTCGTETTICVDNNICINLGDGAVCWQFCDPLATSGAGACGADQKCYELSYESGESTIWGVCQDTCTPYVGTNGLGEGCAAGEWCYPDLYDRGYGTCTAIPTNGRTQGQTCSATQACAAGLECIGGTCEIFCDHQATGTEPGQCESTPTHAKGCSALAFEDGTELAIGMCVDACVYNHTRGQHENPTTPCFTAGEICQPGFLIEAPFDFCMTYEPTMNAPLDELEPCNPAHEFNFCRAGGVCLDLDEGVCDPTHPTYPTSTVCCYEFCDGDVQDVGTANHPDCSRPTAYCTARMVDQTLGLCLNE